MRRRILFVVAFVVVGAGCLPEGDAQRKPGESGARAAAPASARAGATPRAAASQCTDPPKTIFGGTINVCVNENAAGQINAVVDSSIASLHPVPVELLACNPPC